ncbi:MAG: tRNA (adenosine(37)-N6)-threonylcarbamoyltransferase complex transferase subunit TsaD [Rhodothermales bacterium]|nr:tRNA (adenosine(37)-N6)-threonylcarbamoyltransferase complex transferase subunit TsaD [Rhodothermales bacterium]
MTILAIESSCDDTAASIVSDGRVESSIVSSQLGHAAYGGVVPEIASRAHQRMIVPVVQSALQEAGRSLTDVDAVGVTYGPGLAGSLLVGLTFAKGLAVALDLPLVGINHLEGHLYSVYADGVNPERPSLSLIVSGGHTELVRMEPDQSLTVLGKTRDDAAGEALDKFAKLLGLGFPGGPIVDQLAESGDPAFHRYPRARLDAYDFSFSGIKTSVLYHLNQFDDEERSQFIADHKHDLCASFLAAVIDMLMHQLEKALDESDYKSVCLVGGVSANRQLRARISDLCILRDTDLYIPDASYRTDNAAMIGVAAFHKLKAGATAPLTLTIDPSARLK